MILNKSNFVNLSKFLKQFFNLIISILAINIPNKQSLKLLKPNLTLDLITIHVGRYTMDLSV